MRARRLAARRAVGDPSPGQAVEAVDRELPPGDAAREDDRARSDDVAAVEMDLPRRGVDALDRARDEDLRAEPARLLQRAAGELVARHAGGEAEVVLDPRRGPGLTARSLPFHDHGVEPLGRPVDRRSQAGGPGADDHRVVLRRLRLGAQLQQLRDTSQSRADHRLAADDADRRQVGVLWERAVPVVDRARIVRRDPAERDLVAVEEAPEVRAAGVPPLADDDRARRRRLRGEALEAAQPAHPVRGKAPDLPRDVRCRRRERVVVVRVDPHDARRLGGAEADGEHGAQRDRDLAEDLAGMADADRPRDPVDVLDRLDLAGEHREQRALAALVGGVLAGSEADVRRHARQLLALRGIQAREERDLRDFLRCDHRPTLPHTAGASQPAPDSGRDRLRVVQLELERREVLAQVLDRQRARDRQDDGRALEQPGELDRVSYATCRAAMPGSPSPRSG